MENTIQHQQQDEVFKSGTVNHINDNLEIRTETQHKYSNYIENRYEIVEKSQNNNDNDN